MCILNDESGHNSKTFSKAAACSSFESFILFLTVGGAKHIHSSKGLGRYLEMYVCLCYKYNSVPTLYKNYSTRGCDICRRAIASPGCYTLAINWYISCCVSSYNSISPTHTAQSAHIHTHLQVSVSFVSRSIVPPCRITFLIPLLTSCKTKTNPAKKLQ